MSLANVTASEPEETEKSIRMEMSDITQELFLKIPSFEDEISWSWRASAILTITLSSSLWVALLLGAQRFI